jgi:hypothetical protein
MASSSRKGGTWLSRFYHRQAGLVVLIVNLQGQSHSPYHLEYFLLDLEILIHPISQLTLKLFELVSKRTCSLVIDIRVPQPSTRAKGRNIAPFLNPVWNELR